MSKIIVLPVVVVSMLLGSCVSPSCDTVFAQNLLTSALFRSCGESGGNPSTFQLTSSSLNEGFDSGETIPTEFWDNHDTQCMGENNFPQISWTGAPEDTNSFVLIMEDQSTTPTNFVHLNLYDIPADATSIPRIEATASGDMETVDFTGYGSVGMNDWTTSMNSPNPNTTGWAGACPLEGSGAHTYSFKLYALNTATLGESLNAVNQASFEASYGSDETGVILDMAEITAPATQTNTNPPLPPFTLTSSASSNGFDPGAEIPTEFRDNHDTQCAGSNNFPQISWSNVPAGTQSFVLIMQDQTTPFVHLNLYDIPSTLTSISKITATVSGDAETVDFTGYGTRGQNSWNGTTNPNDSGWAGPCPPVGSGAHTYSYRLYALSTATISGGLNQETQASFEATYGSSGTGVILDMAEITAPATQTNTISPPPPFTLTSSVSSNGFDPGVEIPTEFRDNHDTQCAGSNNFPQISWSNVPAGTQSFVLIMQDQTTPFVHLNLYDIPSTLTSISKITATVSGDAETVDFTGYGTVGQNSWNGTTNPNDSGWAGPCPPVGSGAHTYSYRLYALSTATISGGLNQETQASFEATYGSGGTGVILDMAEITAPATQTNAIPPPPSFTLTSSASSDGFDPGVEIPTEFRDNHDTQCAGSNNFPQISWSNVPAGTQSFVLIMQSTTPASFVHLNLYDIPSTLTSISKIMATASGDAETVDFTGYGTRGGNSWDGSTNPNDSGWSGPCPPVGLATYTYSFKLYALSTATLGATLNAITQSLFEATYGSGGTGVILDMAEITAPATQTNAIPPPPSFTLTSSASSDGFDPGVEIPTEFRDNHDTQCAGSNNFPQISWSNVPAGTQSFVLIMQSTTPASFVHLNLYDIPSTLTSISKIMATASGDAETVDFTGYGTRGGNSWDGSTNPNDSGWSGPCPPVGLATYTYSFKLYALSTATLGATLNAITQSLFEATYGSGGTGVILDMAEITAPATQTNAIPPPPSFTLTSSASSDGFDPGVEIPTEFRDNHDTQCAGSNNFPQISWSNVPAGTQSFVLIMQSTTPASFVHLNLYDIPSTLTSISKIMATASGDAETVDFTGYGTRGGNSWDGSTNPNDSGWSGPCPPVGSGTYTYSFRLYALSTTTLGATLNAVTQSLFEATYGSGGTGVILDMAEITAPATQTNAIPPPPSFTLTSSASSDGFDPGVEIPTEFRDNHDTQCAGSNNFPQISWSNVPAGTQSFVLIMQDQTTPFVHLNLYDIPSTLTSISKIMATASGDAETVDFTGYGTRGGNSWDGSTNPNDSGWSGPCPPVGSGSHSYSFKLYALSTATLGATLNAVNQSLFEATYGSGGTGVILDMAEITAPATQTNAISPPPPFTLSSSGSVNDGFDSEMEIPFEFRDNHNTQCAGSNNFPQISWSNVPAGTQSFVLIMQDQTTPFVHLNLYDIPSTLTSISKITATVSGDTETVDFTGYGTVGQNSWNGTTNPNDSGWAGPCPPVGSGSHSYSFKLYALSTATISGGLNQETQASFETTYGSGGTGVILDMAELTAKAMQTNTIQPLAFTLNSIASNGGFTPGGEMPLEFWDNHDTQCAGSNNFPYIEWSNVPAGTQSFMLIMQDQTSPPFVHLNLYNIPSSLTSIPRIEAIVSGDIEAIDFMGYGTRGGNGWDGTNSNPNTTGWAGPCPLTGSGTYTYSFKLYALSVGMLMGPIQLYQSLFETLHGSGGTNIILDMAEITVTATP